MPVLKPLYELAFQSTHPVRGATDYHAVTTITLGISIHAPREGCDRISARRPARPSVFQSTHPVRGATTLQKSHKQSTSFQSTHPVRGATFVVVCADTLSHISIHAPREGCDVILTGRELRRGISIHAPREGCDSRWTCKRAWSSTFQSTHPVRGATSLEHLRLHRIRISIHAPREGCDIIPVFDLCAAPDFNPRTP